MSKPRFHLRSVFKWIGLLSCILLVGISIQAWRTQKFIYYTRNGVHFRLGPGNLWIRSRTTIRPLNSFSVMRHIDSREWFPFWPRITTGKWGATHVTIPSWMLLSIFAIPTTILWWRDRRRFPSGHCQQCGYNLLGLTEPRCPECSTEFDPATVPPLTTDP